MGLNGGRNDHFNEAVSFVIPCKDQEEIDHYWYKLIEGGGKEIACGWLKDRFGLFWQITPTILPQLISDNDRLKAGRVMQAMMKMIKLDIATLMNAAQSK